MLEFIVQPRVSSVKPEHPTAIRAAEELRMDLHGVRGCSLEERQTPTNGAKGAMSDLVLALGGPATPIRRPELHSTRSRRHPMSDLSTRLAAFLPLKGRQNPLSSTRITIASAVDSRSDNPPLGLLTYTQTAMQLLKTPEVEKYRLRTSEGMGWDHMKLVNRLVILAFAGALLAGCGAFQKTAACPPATVEPVASPSLSPSASMTPTTAPSSAPPREGYSFSLGLGDRSAAGQWPDQFVYEALAQDREVKPGCGVSRGVCAM